jgi:predicted dehydrogenase
MRTVKIGLIGAGGIAQQHLRALSMAQGIELVAVADVIKERAENAAQKYGIKHVFQDYHDLLAMDEIEAVSVLTFNQAHRQPTVDALHAGKHVLVEKPMAATLEDAAAMTKTAHETGKILMVAVWTRFSPAMQAAKRIMAAGTLGHIYYAETTACRRAGEGSGSFAHKATAGCGTVADIGVYALDAALNLMGHPKPVFVSAVTNNYLAKAGEQVLGGWPYVPEDIEVEDFGAAWVRFDTGLVMVFKTSWAMHMDNIGGTFFLGTKAGLHLDPLTLYRNEYGLMVNSIPQEIPQVESIQLFKQENEAFADAIREGKPSPIPPEQLLLTNVIIQGVIDSAVVGHEIAVTVPNV